MIKEMLSFGNTFFRAYMCVCVWGGPSICVCVGGGAK